jgi:hypothetical protein
MAMLGEPPAPGQPGHHLPTWAAYKQKQYERKRKLWINRCRRNGWLSFMTGPYWPEVDIDATNPAPLASDDEQDG